MPDPSDGTARKPLRAVGNIRISRVAGRHGDSFIAPDVYRERIRQWAAMRGADLIEITEDLDRSGGNQDRPGIQRALRLIETGQADVLVVPKADRFARSLRDALQMLDRIESAGGKFVSVEEGYDTTTPVGEMALHMMLSFAQFELRRIQQQWRVAQERAVDRGVYIAHNPPVGYRRSDDGHLRPDPEVAPLVAQAFQMRADGEPYTTVADFLTGHGVRSWSDADRWTGQAVSRMLANRAYLGESRFGDFVNETAHDPIVDRVLWGDAQQPRPLPAVRSDEPSLLSGLVRCAACRYVAVGSTSQLRGRTIMRYVCRRDRPGGRCEEPAFMVAHILDPWVEQQFLERAGQIASQRDADDQLADLADTVGEAEADLRAYRDQRISDTLPHDLYVEGLELRAQALRDAESALRRARDEANVIALPARARIEEAWPHLDIRDKQRLLRTAIDCVVLRRGRGLPVEDRAHILWRGEAPDDLPGRDADRRGQPLRPFDWPPTPAQAFAENR